MLEMSWITAILQLYSQVVDLFGNVIVKRINIRLFDLLARFHYILNLPRTLTLKLLTSLLICTCTTYEGCQESSWTHMITASNVPDFDIHYYFSLK